MAGSGLSLEVEELVRAKVMEQMNVEIKKLVAGMNVEKKELVAGEMKKLVAGEMGKLLTCEELEKLMPGKVLRPVGMVVTIGRDMGLSLLSRHGHSQ